MLIIQSMAISRRQCYMTKKTKTPYSWRVAVLPYLDQQSLYGLYHFDEPWDSEHNLQIANTVVPTFCSPTDPGSTDAAYFALVGPATVFAGKNGVKRQQITDGTKDTLLLVEAKRGIPWTKPEDIPYSPDKPLPKLGGFYEGGFSTVTCNGGGFFIPDHIDPQTLRHLIERADGNAVDVNSMGW